MTSRSTGHRPVVARTIQSRNPAFWCARFQGGARVTELQPRRHGPGGSGGCHCELGTACQIRHRERACQYRRQTVLPPEVRALTANRQMGISHFAVNGSIAATVPPSRQNAGPDSQRQENASVPFVPLVMVRIGGYTSFEEERGKCVEFRTEFFNLPNSVSMADPNASFSSSAFGRVTGATAARQVQLALRYSF